MSPILVRPVREQLEHDRVIRTLQSRYKRKFEVAINPGNEQNASVLAGTSPWFPDLIFYTTERGRKLAATVEVETAESVNNLEAMSQWKTFSQQRAPFLLYVPVASVDTARRMAADLDIPVAELWAYSALGDQMRFTLVQKSSAALEAKAQQRSAPAAETKPRSAAAAKPAVARPAAPRAASPNGGARGARPAAAARPARRAAEPAAKARRKTAAASRSAAKAPAARRVAAKKPAARVQKRK